MKRLVTSLVLVAFSCSTFACGEVALPPPAAPAHALPSPPELPNEAVPEGAGRVVLDANGEKARVIEVAGATVHGQGYSFGLTAQRPVCASTPCVVDVSRGPHRFVFLSTSDPNRGSAVEIDIGSKPKVIRHALGERIEHSALNAGSNVSLTLGTLGAITGGSLLLGGALASSSSSNESGSSSGTSVTGVGGAVLGVSAGVLVLGITLGILGRTEVRDGSTTEWSLEGEGQGTPPSPKGSQTTHVRFAPGPGGVGLSF